jgi:hypothetical protein
MMIVFIHGGTGPIPYWMKDTLELVSRVAFRSELIVLTNSSNIKQLNGMGNRVTCIPIESVPKGEATRQLDQCSQLNREFRSGFWFHTMARFFVLADFMRHTGAEDVVHLENDVALYFDPAEKLDTFRKFADFAVPLDKGRAIAGIVWLRNSSVAVKLAEHLLAYPFQNDMEGIGHFCTTHPDLARPLPTIPPAYAATKGLDVHRYCQGIDQFGGIFDAAAIGQYVGGVHWLNNPHDSRFFINESSDLDLRELDISWNVVNGIRSPSLEFRGERVPVLALHAHSKDMRGISPFNHGVPTNSDDVITGERLQALADLTITSATITQFHGIENIRSKRCIQIPQNEAGQICVPDQGFIDECNQAAKIFVYTHLIPYFKRYVLPRLTRPFVVIAHNSDNGIGLDDLDLLNHPLLLRCFAQHPETAHTRLAPLPSGMANRQWGPTRIEQLVAAGRNLQKDMLLYVNVNPTHPSRAIAMFYAQKMSGATIEHSVGFEQFISGLARHKFCLCPRGNGIDSHRFWEALYLDCIPVIVRSDWISTYSEFPVLLLNSWEDLPNVDWRHQYIRIKSTAHRFERLSLAHLARQIEDL